MNAENVKNVWNVPNVIFEKQMSQILVKMIVKVYRVKFQGIKRDRKLLYERLGSFNHLSVVESRN